MRKTAHAEQALSIEASGLDVGLAFTGDGGTGDDVLIGGPGLDMLDGGVGSNIIIA